jgi:2-succinyl-6-hydroxy-2,4-cyclohexadiene-1-carboxylate synthase
MNIKLDNLTINYIPDNFTASSKTTILFLHGFTGSSEDWRFLFDELDDNFNPIAIDLPGHGRSSSPEIIDPYRENSLVSTISGLITKLNITSLVICGYSMGGRIALSFAAKYRDRLNGLILESATAGIQSENDRLQRTEDDAKLADRVIEGGIDHFISDWYNRPLFNSLRKKPDLLEKLAEEKKNISPIGLANALKGFSTGLMTNHWSNLEYMNLPVLLITGEEDVKFSNLNGDMVKLLPDARHYSVKSAGHNVHLENEREFIILLNSFLRKL